MAKQEHKIGENIRKYRLKLDFSHHELSKSTGIAVRTITGIENGTTPDPRIGTVKKIADALNVTIVDLISPHGRTASHTKPLPKGGGKVGENVKKCRKKLGFSHEKLSYLAGIAYSTLTKIEKGAIPDPRVGTVKKIADALDLSVDDLMKK